MNIDFISGGLSFANLSLFDYAFYFFVFYIFYLIIKLDIKENNILDFHILILIVLFISRNGLEQSFLLENFSNLLFSLGAAFLTKVVIENLVSIISKGNTNFEIGEGDILLAGTLGIYFTSVGYFVFIYIIFLLWVTRALCELIIARNKIGKRYILRVAFAPYIIAAFILVVVIEQISINI